MTPERRARQPIHAMTLRTAGLAWLQWNYRAECECGWVQEPVGIFTSKGRARRAYHTHKHLALKGASNIACETDQGGTTA